MTLVNARHDKSGSNRRCLARPHIPRNASCGPAPAPLNVDNRSAGNERIQVGINQALRKYWALFLVEGIILLILASWRSILGGTALIIPALYAKTSDTAPANTATSAAYPR